jgi:hypothetical protein
VTFADGTPSAATVVFADPTIGFAVPIATAVAAGGGDRGPQQ